MGQRHQLFVIAKVKGRYRTLCAIHHQWLYGHTALRRCLGILNIFQDFTNRLPIRQELVAAQRYDGSFWDYTGKKGYDEENNNVPFPFIMTCLIMGASYDQKGYYHNVQKLPFYMPYDGSDNNNGITILDISDLSHPSYCFVDFQGMESERTVPLMTPLSAKTYLEAYYDLSGSANSKDLGPVVKSFEGWNLIPAAVLEDTWPGEGWAESKIHGQGGDGEQLYLKLEKLDIAPESNVETLRDQAMDKLIQAMLSRSEEDPDLMSEAGLLADFLPRLKDKLYNRAADLHWSSYHLDLLFKALQNEVEVDLSPLSGLRGESLALLVSKLLKNGKMRALNLSHRSDISEKDLNSMLSTENSLQYLYLLEMPQIPIQSLWGALLNCEVYHSDLLRCALSDHDFQYRAQLRASMTSMDFRGTNAVSQIVWVGLGMDECSERQNHLPNGRIAWERLKLNTYDGTILHLHGTLAQRIYSLDLPLPARKLVHALLRLLEWTTAVELLWANDLAKGIACSMATSASRANDTGHSVSHLNPELYAAPKEIRHRQQYSTRFSLEVGEWSLFLVSESFNVSEQCFETGRSDSGGSSSTDSLADKLSPSLDQADPLAQDDRAQTSGSASGSDPAAITNQPPKIHPRKAASYALVTRVADTGDSQFMVVDVPTYLQRVMGDTAEAKGLIDIWSTRVSSIKNIEFFGNDTYKIMEHVSSKDNREEDNAAGDSGP